MILDERRPVDESVIEKRDFKITGIKGNSMCNIICKNAGLPHKDKGCLTRKQLQKNSARNMKILEKSFSGIMKFDSKLKQKFTDSRASLNRPISEMRLERPHPTSRTISTTPAQASLQHTPAKSARNLVKLKPSQGKGPTIQERTL
jgi:hypothetical protein